ncbi:MAG: serine/threonine-protein kinase, partial [Myxococcota bacterium]
MGSYTRVCELASGGMGRVDLAVRRDGSFQRLFAVKRLHESFRDDAEFRSMFLDEARIAGLLRHPNVVSVVDVGEDAQGPFLVLDFVAGVSLGDLIRECQERGQLVPWTVALRIALQTAEGLHAAHELRDPETGMHLHLVHRDVSPQNVLLSYDGTAHVTDFGIAKALGRRTKTTTGVLKGKLGYLAPEVLRYEEPDRRSDLFSLGVVLFELLAGRRLYKSSHRVAGAWRVLNEPAPDLGEEREDAPASLVALLFRLLAKDPAYRPATAREVARELDA